MTFNIVTKSIVRREIIMCQFFLNVDKMTHLIKLLNKNFTATHIRISNTAIFQQISQKENVKSIQ